jgi:hypothetical protein
MKKLRALSIKQPFAEQVMRGSKRFEYRSRPTMIRGRVYVYASLKPRPGPDWKRVSKGPDGVPLGVVVGTVEVVGCRQLRTGDYAWALNSPKRPRRPIVPEAHPQPVWFFPFGRYRSRRRVGNAAHPCADPRSAWSPPRQR